MSDYGKGNFEFSDGYHRDYRNVFGGCCAAVCLINRKQEAKRRKQLTQTNTMKKEEKIKFQKQLKRYEEVVDLYISTADAYLKGQLPKCSNPALCVKLRGDSLSVSICNWEEVRPNRKVDVLPIDTCSLRKEDGSFESWNYYVFCRRAIDWVFSVMEDISDEDFEPTHERFDGIYSGILHLLIRELREGKYNKPMLYIHSYGQYVYSGIREDGEEKETAHGKLYPFADFFLKDYKELRQQEQFSMTSDLDHRKIYSVIVEWVFGIAK